MKIYLTGFMGSGKTTVGRALSARLGCNFHDLDAEIEHRTGKSISSLFEDQSENAFRQIETKILQSLTSDPSIIATGGGCFFFNHDWMLENGTVIYLEVPFNTLTQRIGANSSRPLWKNAEKLFQEREENYKTAHFSVNAARSPEEIAIDICNFITSQEKKKNRGS